jgi:pimeloyl-ACP methyl ester carboxylesterase
MFLSRDDVSSSSSIVVFGRSLGAAVAIHLAAENQEKVGL